jgi:hypothetical protein
MAYGRTIGQLRAGSAPLESPELIIDRGDRQGEIIR